MPERTPAVHLNRGLATDTKRVNRNKDRAGQGGEGKPRRTEAGTTDKSATVTNRRISRPTGIEAERPKPPEASFELTGVDVVHCAEGSRLVP